MVMSLARMSAGCGYEYFTKHTARGDAPDRQAGTLVDYYLAAGYPAGVWLGSGLAGLGDGAVIAAGSTVTEEQMARLFGAGHDPLTDTPLGRGYLTRQARATGTKAARASRIRQPVAGFDMTFSVPKSVSTLWALAGEDMRRAIADAHHAAVAATFALAETEVARTRTGFGGTERVTVRGLIAAAFDHYDSRAGDPQLHTHVTVANRVQTRSGHWQTLDSRGLYAAAVALSETYDLLLAGSITTALGLDWEMRRRGRDRNPRREMAAIPDRLIAEFSQRSAAITVAKDAAIAEFTAAHGRSPTADEAIRIRQRATLATRQAKQVVPIDEHRRRWAKRATAVLGVDAATWVGDVTSRSAARPGMTPAPLPDEALVERLAASALDEVEASRPTWSRWNLVAASCRAIAAENVSFASTDAALDARNRVARAAMERCVLLNPSAGAGRAADPLTGRSLGAAPEVFTSLEVLAAESAILKAAESTDAPTTLTPIPADSGATLRSDQIAAVDAICCSGRRVDVLVGPAGAGKTTAMAALRRNWETAHGARSVIGLAPSATAAAVLGAEIGIATENTAQWLAQQQQQPIRTARIAELEARRDAFAAAGRRTDGIQSAIDRTRARYDAWALRPGQLVIVDEAGMADTPTLTALTAHAQAAGAKLLLVGDPEQLPAVGAGGMFRTLAERRPHAAELIDVQRFVGADGSVRTWEAQASLALRLGDAAAITTYDEHGRIDSGSAGNMHEAALAAWRADRRAGLATLLVASDNETVTELNLLARVARIRDGEIAYRGVPLRDGLLTGVGDVIVTRQIDRTLRIATAAGTPAGPATRDESFVKNGDRFVVDQVGRDGSLTVHPEPAARRSEHGGSARSTRHTDGTDAVPTATLTLPAGYVAQHVQLGYAVTAHRAQGVTVDTAHTVADTRMTREAFYVAMTRGRLANRAYIALDHNAPDLDSPGIDFGRDTVLAAILGRTGGQRSAHDVQRELAGVSPVQRPAPDRQVMVAEPPAAPQQEPRSRRTTTRISHLYSRRIPSRRPDPYDRTR